MRVSENIRSELKNLIGGHSKLQKLAKDLKEYIEFGVVYQDWYSRALKLVEALAPERLEEFISYYRIDPKRKDTSYASYVIQDYIKGVAARRDIYTDEPLWDIHQAVMMRVLNQFQILSSLSSRIDSVLQDVTGHLFAEIQDSELQAAVQLKRISKRASGALAGVVLERHLQRAAANHKIPIRKASPTIADLNDPLKQAGVYELPMWRKIQLLADLRNLCSHQKADEPTGEQVDELIAGVNSVIKSVF